MTHAAATLRAHVLVVDDDLDARVIYRQTLEWGGYRVTTATGVAEARRQIASVQPDLVILDATQPDGCALSAIRAWRLAPSTAMMPVVLVTASAQDPDAAAAIEAGVDSVLVKPCWSSLLDRLGEALAPTSHVRSSRRLARYRLRSGTQPAVRRA